MSTITTAAEVRSHLQHPIVDADGHIVECLPVLIDHIRKVAGDDVADRFGGTAVTYSSRSSKLLERSPTHGRAPTRGVAMAPWWALPTNARDRATGFLPGLLAERLDEIGIDMWIQLRRRSQHFLRGEHGGRHSRTATCRCLRSDFGSR